MTQRVHVATPGGGYDILIGERLLAKAGAQIAPLLKNPQVVIVTDENVARFYLHRLTGTLDEHKIRYRCVVIRPGEGSKSLGAFSETVEQILETNPDRHTTLLALGGGVVGDITGFAASVLLRGVDFIQIPTTLLAQVDSSVGGKTGVNSAHGKNLIGTFHQPRLVIADISLLATLPRRERMAGYAEMLKYALIGDPNFFGWLEQNAAEMLESSAAHLVQGVLTCCEAKARIVAADEKEQGSRALLNFGHTFAHALEAETGFSDTLLHGEAVAIGMMLAFRMSVKMGLCGVPDFERLRKHYETLDLPDSPLCIQPQWDVDALVEHMLHDKKNKDGLLTLILTHGIGRAYISAGTEPAQLRAFLSEAIE